MKTFPVFCSLLATFVITACCHAADDRPNILWITSEDNGPELGCYGDEYADTPNIDALAEKGMRYSYCWSSAPVCAPARTAIISGMWPPSLGAQHMRSYQPMPEGFQMYPQFLAEAGYYCTNNKKEDYNLAKPGKVWSESSSKAHWKNRDEDQPFFAIFNHTISHESQLRKRPHEAVHDPAGVRVPKYHPDTPEVRQDWAQYYDKLTEMDARVGKNLDELEAAGLAEDTIVFYYGDHGSGMPRHKRWPYNSGLHVPLVVFFPPKYEHLAPQEYEAHGVSKRVVSFIDQAPTLQSVCGISPPEWMQGQAFAGQFETEKPEYIYGFRGRMDERPDIVRSIRNERYIYIRHFHKHRPYGQFVHYMFRTPTTRKWYELHLAGQLTAAQDLFWQPKPVEELYDLKADPDEVVNLSDSPEHAAVMSEFRRQLLSWMRQTKDLGIIPEAELNRRIGNESGYEVQREGNLLEDYESTLLLAAVATRIDLSDADLQKIKRAFESEEPVHRYWACQWALQSGNSGTQEVLGQLRSALRDESPSVRICAAEALGEYGNQSDLNDALKVLLEAADLTQSSVYAAVEALNAIDYLDHRAAAIRDRVAELPDRVKQMPPRTSNYVGRLKEKVLSDLDGKPVP